MKIVTKLKIFGLFATILLIILGITIFWRSSQVDDALEKSKTASSIVKDAFLLTLLNNEYRQNHGERAETQWKSQYTHLNESIASYKAEDIEEKEIVEALHLGQAEMLRHFSQLQKNIQDQEQLSQSNASSQALTVAMEAERRLSGQLGIDMQKIISLSSALETINSTKLSIIRKSTLVFVVVVIIVLSVSLLLTYFLFARSISKAIKRLIEGTRMLASGNLDVKLTLKNNDEFGQLGDSFNEMVIKLKELDQDKSDFITLASHQLRTPLTIINWYAEMLLSENKGKLNDTQKKYLDGLYDGSKRMVKLSNDLLKLAQLQLGKFTTTMTSENIEEIVKQCIKEFEELVANRKLTLIQDIEPNLPEIKVDVKLLTLVLENLLSNSIQYTPEGGKVTLAVQKQLNNIIITISDTGVGIPKDQQAQIFTKLFRADNVKGLNINGAGLGLYVTKLTVDNLGYTIGFDSTEGKGSRFYVTLPQDGIQ